MRRAFFALLLLAAPLSARPAAAEWRSEPMVFFDKDKQFHFHTSMVATVATAEFLKYRGMGPWRATLLSGFLWGSAGVLKEFALDRHVSSGDLHADALGVATGMGFEFCYRF
ncbi:MAG: hypothetical protein HYZ75_14880 [Elusimicrobia bacterium]|nr:hypothetical protein [Elusimicrobiota bacterium]